MNNQGTYLSLLMMLSVILNSERTLIYEFKINEHERKDLIKLLKCSICNSSDGNGRSEMCFF